MGMSRIVPPLAAALLLAATVACEDLAGPTADPTTTSAEVEVERASGTAANPTGESNSATTEPATDEVGGAAPSPSPTVAPTPTDTATGDSVGAEEDEHSSSPTPSIEETPESPADGPDRQDDTVENLEPSDTPTPEASEAPEASTPETDGEDDPEEPEPTSVPTPELTDAELAALECGNEVGNGDQIITGPSAPEAHDRDSVFRSLTVHPTDPDTVIMGTERNGFAKSTDGGVTWTRSRLGLRWSEGIGYPEVYDLAYSPSDPDVLIAATVSSPGPLVGDFPTTMRAFI